MTSTYRKGKDTYSLRQPFKTHWRSATCAEKRCKGYLNGWRTIVPTGSDHADYIRHHVNKRYREVYDTPGMTTFVFEPGQPCFEASRHRLPIGRPFNPLINDRLVEGAYFIDRLYNATTFPNITEV